MYYIYTSLYVFVHMGYNCVRELFSGFFNGSYIAFCLVNIIFDVCVCEAFYYNRDGMDTLQIRK